MTVVWTLARIVWIEMLRRKDVYVLFILLAGLLLTLISLDIYGLGQVTAYVKEIGLLGAWILGWILALNTSVRQLPQEETRGTIFPLLAKPVSRAELVLGKWLGAWAIACAATLSFYAATSLVVVLRGGGFAPATLVQAFLLHMTALGVLAAIGIALSTRLNRDAATAMAYVLTGATFLIVPRVPSLLVTSNGPAAPLLLGLYYALPHFELFDERRRLVHDWGAAQWIHVCGVIGYGVLLVAVFLLLAWIGYRRKTFSRGELL